MDALDRRAFLRLAGLTGLGWLGSSLVPGGLLAAADPPAVAPDDDYRAVVCLYLDGGLDHQHVVTPNDPTSFAALAALRPVFMSLPRTAYLPLGAGGQNGRELAFHPDLPGFKGLFDAGRLAYVSGVGELERPTTRAEIMDGRYRLGRAVGSHNDGTAYANGFGYEGTLYGWGGLILDAVSGLNQRRTMAAINLYDTIFASGRLNQRTQVNSLAKAANLMGLDEPLGFGDPSLAAALRGFAVSQDRTHLMEEAVTGLARHVDAASAEAKTAFAASDAAVPAFTYPDGTPVHRGRDNDLARQFRTVARIMQQRSILGVRRQVFNLGLRGFDTHGNSNDAPFLLSIIDAALVYFFQTLDALGLADRVTVVMPTEFGRSLNGNQGGTDHGWGGGWFVAGGAVRGRNVYGRIPVIDPAGQDYQTINNPVQIPQIAPEQVAATVGRWFGVPGGDLTTMFPRLAAFPAADLGFMTLPTTNQAPVISRPPAASPVTVVLP
jgi:uncharacterized protein (DUF1501 family)